MDSLEQKEEGRFCRDSTLRRNCEKLRCGHNHYFRETVFTKFMTLHGLENFLKLFSGTLLSVLLGRHGSASLCRDGQKQNGGYNASISFQTLIFHLVVNSTRLKTVRSALWRCPNSTVALRLLKSIVKVTNLEVVKIEFRHPIILLLSSASLAP